MLAARRVLHVVLCFLGKGQEAEERAWCRGYKLDKMYPLKLKKNGKMRKLYNLLLIVVIIGIGYFYFIDKFQPATAAICMDGQAKPVAAPDTRCSTNPAGYSTNCPQLCIGSDCRNAWPPRALPEYRVVCHAYDGDFSWASCEMACNPGFALMDISCTGSYFYSDRGGADVVTCNGALSNTDASGSGRCLAVWY